MALSRIGNSADLANLFVRSSYAATSPRHGRQNVEQLHATVVRRYPEAPELPLPSNVSEIFNIETSRFAPERARDLSAPLFLYGSMSIGNNDSESNSYGFADSVKMQQLDSRVESFDCFGAVSLNGSMQTNVPKPFCANGRSTYLNMPGGQFARDGKYLAEIMRKSHFKMYQMRQAKRSGGLDGLFSTRPLVASNPVVRTYSTSVDTKTAENKMSANKLVAEKKYEEQAKKKRMMEMTKREKFELMIKVYGKTLLFVHVGISLVSLGIFYTIVSSGVDLTPMIQHFSGGTPDKVSEDKLVTKIMSGGSTFVIAYAVHKLTAPIRLSISFGLTPIIVRFLRRKGIIKPPKNLQAAMQLPNTTSRR